MMTKGKQIRHLIAQGQDDLSIVGLVDTTLNSVRWHRSKMRADNRLAPKPSIKLTVGAMLEQRGLVEIVKNCIKSESEDVGAIYKRLAAWTFVTNHKVTSRLGQCRYSAKTIEVHGALADLPDDFNSTFLHECAHALDYLIFGDSDGHGPRWADLMNALGQPAETTGNDSSQAVKEALQKIRFQQAVEIWVCTCCGSRLPIVRKRKYPISCYTHPPCGGHFRVE